MPSSISWLHDTFYSTEATQRLLAPELEAGLSYHDFQAACEFFPGRAIRRYQYAGPILGSTAAGAYWVHQRRSRRPPPTYARFWLYQSIGIFAGFTAGVWLTAQAHATFVRSLHDRKAFFRALENVHNRLENPRVTPGPDASDQAAWSETPSPSASVPSPRAQSAPRPSSKWDDIRAANAPRSGPRSAWDRLRQPQTTASRTQGSPSDPSDDAREPNPSDADAERAAEQAKFDAMLDAERRKAEAAQARVASWGST